VIAGQPIDAKIATVTINGSGIICNTPFFDRLVRAARKILNCISLAARRGRRLGSEAEARWVIAGQREDAKIAIVTVNDPGIVCSTPFFDRLIRAARKILNCIGLTARWGRGRPRGRPRGKHLAHLRSVFDGE